MSAYLKQLYLSEQVDEVVLVYQEYISALTQTPGQKMLLPASVSQGDLQRRQEYLYEPDKKSVLDQLVELYLDHTVYIAMLEAKTSEHSARMTAMTSASDNADELIVELHLELNHVDPDDTEENLAKAFRPNTKCVVAETIANPALTVLDIDESNKL